MEHPEQNRARFKAITAEIAAVEAETTPLRQERDAALAQAQPFESRARELGDEILRIERDQHLSELKMELSRLAKALGGRSMSGL